MSGEYNRATFQYDPVGLGHTFTTILDKIESFLTQSGWQRPSWDTGSITTTLNTGASSPFGTKASTQSRFYIRTDRNTQDTWRYTGDAVTQHGGIVVSYDNSASVGSETGPQIVIMTFVQNSAATGSQVTSGDGISGSGADIRYGSIRVQIDNLTVNNWFIYGGEQGLYIEVGSNGLPTNLGHGSIMVFGAIPEFHGTRDFTVQWTAQGLVCDFTRNCKFTASRNDRFVTNDGTSKNFTASLQPLTPRGTASIYSLSGNVEDRRGYYIGAQDNFLSQSVAGTAANTTVDVATTLQSSIKFAASFGLINSPLDGRFRLSPLMMAQHMGHEICGVTSSSGSNNVASASNTLFLLDVRAHRRIYKLVAADYTLLPFVNVIDAVTGATYRIVRVDDNGRFSHLGVEVPSLPALVL